MNDAALSALMDGECSPAELDRLLEAMERDPALKDRYSRLCLLRDSLRGVRVKALRGTLGLDFAGRVLARLDQASGQVPASGVLPFRTRPAAASWRPWTAGLMGLAAAAGVAAVALLTLRPDAPAPDQSASAAQAQAELERADTSGRHWTELTADNARQLNRYLSAYSQSRAAQAVGGTLSHVRYAGLVDPPAAEQRAR